eukprot:1704925-Amphidinium_carterae.1
MSLGSCWSGGYNRCVPSCQKEDNIYASRDPVQNMCVSTTYQATHIMMMCRSQCKIRGPGNP